MFVFFVLILQKSERKGKMCPLWPVHYVFMYLAVLGPLWLLSFRLVGAASDMVTNNSNWNVTYEPSKEGPILMDDWNVINVSISILKFQLLL